MFCRRYKSDTYWKFAAIIHPDPRKPYDSPTMLCFEIPAKLVPDLKTSLRRCGVHPPSVFPRLGGVAKALSSGAI
jgi:hypothetical protein